MSLQFFFIIGFLLISAFALPQSIKIGGLFDIWDEYEEAGFIHAAERLNSNRISFPLFEIKAQIEMVQNGDSYNASKLVCELLKEGVGSIIGPQTPVTASHVQSVCEVFNMPRIETKWDFRLNVGDFLINLYPHPPTLSMAYSDIIHEWGWRKIIIIYENNESLVRLQGIFNSTGTVIDELVLKQLPTTEDFRPLMKDLRMNYADKTSIVIDCDSVKLPRIFQDARSEGMTTYYYKYFLTSLDIHTLNEDEIIFGDVNITAFRLIDPLKPKVQEIIESWKARRNYSPSQYFNQQDPFYSMRNNFPSAQVQKILKNVPNLRNNMLRTETALLYDALDLFAQGIHLPLDNGQKLRTESIDCDSANIVPWSQGQSLMRNLKEVQFDGLSGFVQIDPDGKRRNFSLEVIELTQKGIVSIGKWSPYTENKFFWTRTEAETQRLRAEDLKTADLIVTTKESEPYCFYNKTTEKFEGYSVDLIQKLSEHFGFQYKFKLVADNSMGSKTNKSRYRFGWDGMIGEILEGKADLAIGDMSITYDRGNAIDFSLPFMNIGISILYKKPIKKSVNLFSFLEPFSYEVWIYMATAYLGVSLILFIIARVNVGEWGVSAMPVDRPGEESQKMLENPFSLLNAHWLAVGSLMGQGCDILPKITPFQWLNPHPCKDDPDELVNDLTLLNTLWFSIGSLMQQGSDIAPKAGSTRTVAGIWWFFTLIMISSYTANLAAFLTSEGLEEGIKEIKDLPKQTKVKFGTMVSGSTRDFFAKNSFPLYKEINKIMENMRPVPFVSSTKAGVNKVRSENGSYAFFMESASIEYQTERDCTLIQLGGLLDSKGFGIGLKKGSKYRDAFNIKILELQQSGFLEELKTKWWKTRGGGKCKAETSSNSGAKALTLGHVGGVFVVLLAGCSLACVMVIFEFMWKARKLAKDDRGSFWTEVAKELKFAIQCHNDTKPIQKSRSLNPTVKSESVSYLALHNNGKDQSNE